MEKVTDGQKFALIKLCSKFSKLRTGRLYLLSTITNREITTTSDMLLSEWRTIRDEAYPNWHDNNWEMVDNFKAKCETIMSDFEEKVLGQLSLGF